MFMKAIGKRNTNKVNNNLAAVRACSFFHEAAANSKYVAILLFLLTKHGWIQLTVEVVPSD
jgi:hypothetical protein